MTLGSAIALWAGAALVGWCLYLWRTDVARAARVELAALRDEVRAEVMRTGPAVLALDARMDVLAGRMDAYALREIGGQ